MERSSALVLAMVAIAGRGYGGSGVTVCVSRGGAATYTVAQAKIIAARMFDGIGIPIDWRQAGPKCPATAIAVNLTGETPQSLLPGAVAYARPYEGHARVFFDRVHERAVNFGGLEPYLLAHVLVHEITHVLQGVSVHSDRGVMKAVWDPEDYARMMRGGLEFVEEDVVLLRNSMETLAARQYNNSGS